MYQAETDLRYPRKRNPQKLITFLLVVFLVIISFSLIRRYIEYGQTPSDYISSPDFIIQILVYAVILIIAGIISYSRSRSGTYRPISRLDPRWRPSKFYIYFSIFFGIILIAINILFFVVLEEKPSYFQIGLGLLIIILCINFLRKYYDANTHVKEI